MLSNGTAVSGYLIKRYNASTLAPQTIGSGCTGTITALTCTENAVPTGQWRYSVTPVFAANWMGAESAMSTTVVVDATPPTGTIGYTNGYQVGKYVSITLTSSSGVGSVNGQLQRTSAQFVNGACETFGVWSNVGPANPGSPISDTSVSNSTCYQYRYVLTDSLGFTFTATTSSVAWVDYAGAVRYETPGVVMQWRLGDSPSVNGTAAADSAGTNVGTYSSGVTEGLTGDLPNDSNTAAGFNGTSGYVEDLTPTGLPVGNATRSVEIWFKTTSTNQQTLFTYGSRSSESEFGLMLTDEARYLTAWGYGASNDLTFELSQAENDGRWHQIVETYDGTNIEIYIDGSVLATQKATRNTIIDRYGFQLGAIVVPNDTYSGSYFAGSLDELSVYNVALTATNVQNHYQLGANTNTDSTGPTGGSIAVSGLGGTGGLYSTSATLHVTMAKGTDPSGVASTGALEFESIAPLASTAGADGVCGTFGALTLVATDPSTPSTLAVTDNQCYVLEYSVPDVLGNYTTYSTGIIKVDTTAPPLPTLAFSALTATAAPGTIAYTLYYRPTSPSGSFTVKATSVDPTSGIATYSFPTLGTNWTMTGSGATRTYGWTSTPSGSGNETVTVTNNAGLSSSAFFMVIPDSTGPTAGSISYLNGTQATTSTPITFVSGTDAGSGIATTSILRRTATLIGTTCGTYGQYTSIIANATASPYTDSTLSVNRCYQYELTQTDAVGNATTTTSTNVLKVN